MSAAVDPVLAHVDAHIGESLERLMALVRIPSISTDPAYAAQCTKAGQWLVDDLAGQGYDASLRQTAGHPMVVAHDKGATSGPHVLFYGHYDVQPVDPIGLWSSDPFEPALREGPDGEKEITGRGTSDDKGQLLTFVEACRAWKAVHGTLPLRVTFLFEGEEESGSPSLLPFLDATGDELRADVALVCDTDMWGPDTPSINSMLRGLVGEELTITCADKDLHSGMFGSAARNPNQVLAEIIASLRNPDGSVAIEGFYDDVAEVPAAVAEQWRNLGFSEAGYLGSVGLKTPAGEAGRSVLEQIWSRPTCEINGMWGGYTGDGFKTVIPSKASAKISFRLVSGQDPVKIRAAFRAHVEARLPADCTVSFKPHGGSPAITVPVDGPYLAPALAALTDEWNKPAVVVGSGGSIPVVGEFKRRLGMDTLLIGFARIDDRIHSPNEKYNLKSFHKGIRSWVRVLDALAAVK
ncbi:Acetylornithine deacetylase/Succinyl-diaminopimelate desuccinylase [Devosia enhydra]|uniref:Acetylornithine deacetylase/Succinyl-diaminopimelate desuccinylase n=1 Tax=Devosia enhydra TaxID=665118 RepID=A0A1K2HWZ8_9HYPH|nr:M20/M25/M40 family metallo-hydrolase [Devosia enhydra]SFZ83685.1 Acetylornithine deacetylase/Succinyl-diaminopimelate desuccinylase [Devosia enhydra]